MQCQISIWCIYVSCHPQHLSQKLSQSSLPGTHVIHTQDITNNNITLMNKRDTLSTLRDHIEISSTERTKQTKYMPYGSLFYPKCLTMQWVHPSLNMVAQWESNPKPVSMPCSTKLAKQDHYTMNILLKRSHLAVFKCKCLSLRMAKRWDACWDIYVCSVLSFWLDKEVFTDLNALPFIREQIQ